MQKIFVLYTGGTIGMKPSPAGLVPDAELAEQALQPYAEQAVFHWHICQPLIDSSNITPQHWTQWLAILQAALPEHDGILVLHGTDTLAYTANFLALALDSGCTTPLSPSVAGSTPPLAAANAAPSSTKASTTPTSAPGSPAPYPVA